LQNPQRCAIAATDTRGWVASMRRAASSRVEMIISEKVSGRDDHNLNKYRVEM
jgi:hypothetical protein